MFNFFLFNFVIFDKMKTSSWQFYQFTHYFKRSEQFLENDFDIEILERNKIDTINNHIQFYILLNTCFFFFGGGGGGNSNTISGLDIQDFICFYEEKSP